MKKLILFIALAFCIAKKSSAQNNEVDSLTFGTEKGLLIFEGYLNGVKTDFAFDTGAGMGVLNSENVSNSNIKRKGSTKINDSQKNSAKLDLAKINDLKIGSYNFQNITSVVADMPFLYCNNAYLLGGDVINKLNWKFDFQKNRVYFSKKPFTPQERMTEMPFKIIGNRHFSNLIAQGSVIDSVLIDFGFAGNCTMDLKFSSTKEIMSKISPENIYASKSSSMGLNSMSIGKTTNSFFLDSVVFGGVAVNNFKVNAMNDTHNKIGLSFLKKSFSEIILNNTELKYWLQPNSIVPQKQTSFDAGFHFNDKNKIEVVSLNGAANHTAQSLNIGQTILELNGRSAESFTDKCEFLIWYAEQAKKEEFGILTDKGEKLTIKKSVF
ncbi:retroviral-like aspartic protease family protein [Pedobacter aquatilis]|uniref:retroviral-like aspartic protease family protein n=1 Tax=Pedobacter aquatilis TaxID=351343 RepID=UPI00292F5358|nr:retroviral-like aspartic protease family protein [Pedobacter aquatilis]